MALPPPRWAGGSFAVPYRDVAGSGCHRLDVEVNAALLMRWPVDAPHVSEARKRRGERNRTL